MYTCIYVYMFMYTYNYQSQKMRLDHIEMIIHFDHLPKWQLMLNLNEHSISYKII